MITRLLRNIGALGIIQVAAFVIPLLTLPYLIRVVGPGPWGAVAIANIAITLCGLLTTWGFNLSGTRKIAASRDDPQKIKSYFTSIWTAQWLLAAAAAATLLVFSFALPQTRVLQSYLVWSITSILASVLLPQWFLMGLERMGQIAIAVICARLIAVPLLFLCVDSPEDAPLIIAINGLTQMLLGLLYLPRLAEHLSPPTRSVLAGAYRELREGFTLFQSSMWIALYTSATPLVLAAMAGISPVGHFSLADRIRQFAQAGLTPVSASLYPRMAALIATDHRAATRVLFWIGGAALVLAAAISAGLFTFAQPMIHLLAGAEFDEAIVLLQILSPLPLIVQASNILGLQILLPRGHQNEFNRVVMHAGLLSTLIVAPVIHFFGAVGAASTIVAIELFVALAMLGEVRRLHSNKSKDL
jgi:PST family polysaccharide transporter